jgi:hypothetical protein
MEWKHLSDKAKSILEWLEDPFTGKKQELYLEIDKEYKVPGKIIKMDAELFNEIRQYLRNNTQNYNSMTSNRDIKVSLR